MKKISGTLQKMNICYLKDIFFPVIAEDGSIIVDYYIRVMLFLYPLFLDRDRIKTFFTSQSALYYIITFLSATVYIIMIVKKRTGYRKKLRTLDIALSFVFLGLGIRVIMRICQKITVDYSDIFLIFLIITYFLLRTVKNGYRYYINLIVFSAAVLYSGLLCFLISGQEEVLGIDAVLRWPEAISSWILLVICSSSILYCMEDKKGWQYFYFIITGLGFLYLSVYSEFVAICLTGLFLLIIPMVFPPTVTLIKKNLILLFLLFFTISNVPLLGYFKWIQVENTYNFGYCMYIDLFLAAAGCVICQYWKRIPNEINPDTIIMIRIKKWYGRILTAAVIILMAGVLTGGRMETIEEGFGVEAGKEFIKILTEAVMNNKSMFLFLFETYGFIGNIVWICLMVMIIRQLRKQWRNADRDIRIIIMLSFLFLIQTFFYQFQPFSTPLYIMLLTFALFADNSVPYKNLKRR